MQPRGCFLYGEHCGLTCHRWTSNLPVSHVGLPWWLSGKESVCQCSRQGFDPWVRKIPERQKWQLTPVFLPGKSHGQRSSAGYRPWDHKESGMTEQLNKPCTWKMAWKTKRSTISLSLTLFCSLFPFLPFVSRVALGKLLSPTQYLSLTICKMGVTAVPRAVGRIQ